MPIQCLICNTPPNFHRLNKPFFLSTTPDQKKHPAKPSILTHQLIPHTPMSAGAESYDQSNNFYI